jgi:hypothetical protein
MLSQSIDLGSIRLSLSAKISQPWNSVFLSQQIIICISIYQKYSQLNIANHSFLTVIVAVQLCLLVNRYTKSNTIIISFLKKPHY